MAVCPICGATYRALASAVSRVDSNMLICPDCGLREAMNAAGMNEKEQQELLTLVHKQVSSGAYGQSAQ